MSALWRGGVPPEVADISATFEDFRSAPYRDSGGKWTIGYGSTRAADGLPVTADTPPVTKAQAAAMAERDLARAADLVLAALPDGLPPRWAAVCISLANNLGDLRVKARTLLRLLKEQDWLGAAEQLKAYRNVAGVPSLGLRRRRWAEAAYALGMDMDRAHAFAWAEISSPDDWPPLPAGEEPMPPAAPDPLAALTARVAALEAKIAAMAKVLG